MLSFFFDSQMSNNHLLCFSNDCCNHCVNTRVHWDDTLLIACVHAPCLHFAVTRAVAWSLIGFALNHHEKVIFVATSNVTRRKSINVVQLMWRASATKNLKV